MRRQNKSGRSSDSAPSDRSKSSGTILCEICNQLFSQNGSSDAKAVHHGDADSVMNLQDDNPDPEHKEPGSEPFPFVNKSTAAEVAAGKNAHTPLYKGADLTVAQFSLLAVDLQACVLSIAAL